MSILIKNIKSLIHIESHIQDKYSGIEMSNLKSIDNAYLHLEEDKIVGFGTMNDSSFQKINLEKIHSIIEASGRLVFPSWCDAHTHLVYAGTREKEFVDRINGLTYEEIFARGGGILNSSNKLRMTSEDDLFDQAMIRINDIIAMGTGAVEIKSGYGLSVESELKMLRVIKRISENSPIKVRSTFLGAHAVPLEFKGNKNGYLDLLINEMLPAIAEEKLADY